MNKYPNLQHANTLIECFVFLKEQERAELERAADTDAFSPVLWWTTEGGGHPQG